MCNITRISYFWLIISIWFCDKGGANVYFFQPPILDIKDAYVDLDSNSTLQINCVGKAPVYWKLPETKSIATNDSRLSIKESEDVHQNVTKYKSRLIVHHLEYMDTGSYSCYYAGTTDWSLRNNVTSVYVFVNDPVNLFVENAFYMTGHMLVILQQNKKGLIACLPTNSRTNVTLWKTEVEDDKGEMVPLGTDVMFDHTQGFHLFYPTFYFNGIFQCRASLGKHEQEINLTLYYIPGTVRDPQPFIDISEAQHPVVNGTFTLKCSVIVDIGTLFFIEWSYPNKNNSRIKEIAPFSEIKTIRNDVHQAVTAFLIVNNVHPNDTGVYRCSVTDHSDKTGSDEVKIFVYAFQQLTHVNFTTDIDLSGPVVHQAGQDVKFVITVHAFPTISDVELYWKKNDESLPTDTRYHFKRTATSVIFEISHLSRSDAGVFTLFGKTSDMINSISIILDVKDKPIVTVRSTESIYLLDEPYTLECHGDGYPTPEVWWRWKPCDIVRQCSPGAEYGWHNVEPSSIFPNQDNVSYEVMGTRNYSTVAYLRVVAKHSGHYLCIASNSLGNDDAVTPFIVSDARQGFEISISNKKPIDRDFVTLTCKANVYNYTQVEWKWRPMEFLNERVPIKNSSDVSIETTSSPYSHSSVVIFEPIGSNSSGEYECIATPYNGNETSSQHITIDVQEIQKPVFNKTNMNGISIITTPATLQEFYCYARGIPEPTIIWKKDGLLFDVTNMSGVELNEGNQRLTIKRVLEKDAGFYECLVENKGGVIKANVTLDVLGDNEVNTQTGLSSTDNIFIVVFVVFAIIIAPLLFCLVKRIREERKQKKEFDFITHNMFERGYVDIFNPNLPLEDQIELLPYKQVWEFPKERLKLGKTLGQGAFGRVVKAEAIGLIVGEASTIVAVKMLKETANNEQRKALIAELKILIHLGRHLNIVNLLGAVTKNLTKGELMVIVEYCCFGNLRHFLLKHKGSYIDQLDHKTGTLDPSISTRPGSPRVNLRENAIAHASVLGLGMDNPSYGQQSLHYADLSHQQLTDNSDTGNTMVSTIPSSSSGRHSSPSTADCGSECCNEETVKNHFITTCDLLCFAFQCARGMEYLISKKLIHRDLAARNVLLAKDNVVKICDFGLAKDCYKYSNYVKKTDGLLPIKWMAIESIRDRVFTSKSDVWSFGVLLWEIFTLGCNPYPGTEMNEEFFKRLQNGYRLEKPDLAPESIYQLMRNCWLDEPNRRPDFGHLSESIGTLLETSVRKYYVELNTPYQAMNEMFKNNNDYLLMGQTLDEDYTKMEEYNESKPEQITQNDTPNSQNLYDNISSVRPIGNGPIPKEPMEVVPMIQLESISQPWHETADVDARNENSQNVYAYNGLDDTTSDYLSMQNSSEKDHCNSDDDDDSVFLEHGKGIKQPHYVNGFIQKIEGDEISTSC